MGKVIKYHSGALMDGDDYIEVHLPAHWEICNRCDGDGTHVNPAIDGNGLSSQDFEDYGEDFRDRYFSGLYDVVCGYCNGAGKQLVADELDESHDLYESYIDWKSDFEYGEFIAGRNEKAMSGYNFDIRDDYWS